MYRPAGIIIILSQVTMAIDKHVMLQLVAKLPKAIVRSRAVVEFLEPWPTDLVTYVNVNNR